MRLPHKMGFAMSLLSSACVYSCLKIAHCEKQSVAANWRRIPCVHILTHTLKIHFHKFSDVWSPANMHVENYLKCPFDIDHSSLPAVPLSREDARLCSSFLSGSCTLPSELSWSLRRDITWAENKQVTCRLTSSSAIGCWSRHCKRELRKLLTFAEENNFGNLLALPQHQHTSFLCPDVSDRIALSFFKELLNKRTVTKSSRLKTKKKERNQKQSTIWKKDKIVRESAWQTHSMCECDENATGKQTQRKHTGSTNKKQLDPENDWKKRNIRGGGIKITGTKQENKNANHVWGSKGATNVAGSRPEAWARRKDKRVSREPKN